MKFVRTILGIRPGQFYWFFQGELTMKQKTLDFLEAHKSEQPSTFTEDAKWRQENEVWLK